jgi:hypothetical protein
MGGAAISGMALASVMASIASRITTTRQQSNIGFVNDINLELLKDSALFNLKIAINSLHRTGDLRSFSKGRQSALSAVRV